MGDVAQGEDAGRISNLLLANDFWASAIDNKWVLHKNDVQAQKNPI